MRLNIFKLICSTALGICLASCANSKTEEAYPELRTIADNVKQKYVPDSRDNVYDIQIKAQSGSPVLKGYTNIQAAKDELIAEASKNNKSVIDSIIVLPDPALGDKTYGVINISVADGHTLNDYSAEMGTQLLLGEPIEVLQHDGWWRIKSPEGYVTWILEASFTPMNKAELNQWNAAPKIIFTDMYGFAYEKADEKSQTTSDLVFGNMLKFESTEGRFYKVSYPDGKSGYVLQSQSQPFDKWYAGINLTEESILKKALLMKGIPYTWGGTSVKMMDCSGFSKMVMLMHGIVLKRDASQQVHYGTPIDISNGYENLHPGDLMFFGKKAQDGKKERIRHVGFYMGNNEFIHAAGYVKIGSLDSTKTNYDKRNTEEFIRATRVIGAVGTEGITPIVDLPLYQQQK